jgi:hypothetical protein
MLLAQCRVNTQTLRALYVKLFNDYCAASEVLQCRPTSRELFATIKGSEAVEGPGTYPRRSAQ